MTVLRHLIERLRAGFGTNPQAARTTLSGDAVTGLQRWRRGFAFGPQVRAEVWQLIADVVEAGVSLEDALETLIEGCLRTERQALLHRKPEPDQDHPVQRQVELLIAEPAFDISSHSAALRRLIGLCIVHCWRHCGTFSEDLVFGPRDFKIEQLKSCVPQFRLRCRGDTVEQIINGIRHIRILRLVCGRTKMEDGGSFRKRGAARHKHYGRAAA